jgi:hypothetical protein
MRDHSRRLVLSTVLGLGAITGALFVPAASFAATTTATPTTTTATCGGTHWPLSAQGQPLTLVAGARAGDYLWHNDSGWHLRVTHPGTTRIVFSGTIVSNAPLSVSPFKLERGDTYSLSADKKTLTYRFANHGRIDGLDLRTACATRLWVRGSMAGAKLPTSRILIGRAGRHPLQNPFVILRTQ